MVWVIPEGNGGSAADFSQAAGMVLLDLVRPDSLVGLAWGGDLVRGPEGWRPRRFAGDRWFQVRSAEERRFILNTYRVLLTRARYETVIWVPRGSATGEPFHDTTRDAAEMDAIAGYLLACGARPLKDGPPARAVAATLL